MARALPWGRGRKNQPHLYPDSLQLAVFKRALAMGQCPLGMFGEGCAGQALQPAVGAVDTGDDVTFAWQSPVAGWPTTVRVACSVNGDPWRRWVLRRELSMQNCAFPGPRPVDVPQGAPLEIRASLVL